MACCLICGDATLICGCNPNRSIREPRMYHTSRRQGVSSPSFVSYDGQAQNLYNQQASSLFGDLRKQEGGGDGEDGGIWGSQRVGGRSRRPEEYGDINFIGDGGHGDGCHLLPNLPNLTNLDPANGRGGRVIHRRGLGVSADYLAGDKDSPLGSPSISDPLHLQLAGLSMEAFDTNLHKSTLNIINGGSGLAPESNPKPDARGGNPVKSKRVCFDYQKGECFRGGMCRFRHIKPEEVAIEQEQQRARLRELHIAGRRECTASSKESNGDGVTYKKTRRGKRGGSKDSKGSRDSSKERGGSRDVSREGSRDGSRPLSKDSKESLLTATKEGEVMAGGRQIKSKRACFDFQNGECFRGSGCKFRHEITNNFDGYTDDARSKESVNGEMTRGMQIKSKRACFDFQKGDCFRGSGCKFRHELVSNFEPYDKAGIRVGHISPGTFDPNRNPEAGVGVGGYLSESRWEGPGYCQQRTDVPRYQYPSQGAEKPNTQTVVGMDQGVGGTPPGSGRVYSVTTTTTTTTYHAGLGGTSVPVGVKEVMRVTTQGHPPGSTPPQGAVSPGPTPPCDIVEGVYMAPHQLMHSGARGAAPNWHVPPSTAPSPLPYYQADPERTVIVGGDDGREDNVSVVTMQTLDQQVNSRGQMRQDHYSHQQGSYTENPYTENRNNFDYHASKFGSDLPPPPPGLGLKEDVVAQLEKDKTWMCMKCFVSVGGRFCTGCGGEELDLMGTVEGLIQGFD